MTRNRTTYAVAVLASTALAVGVPAAPAHGAGTGSRAQGVVAASAGALSGTTTAAPAFHLMAVGDIAREGGAQAATAAVVAGRSPQALLLLGDIAYDNGSASEFASWFDPAYGRFLPISWPVPGNHEYRTAKAGGYRTYFGVAGPTWWARRAGAWVVLGLDSEKVGNAIQRAFVRATLRANQGRPTLVVWHRPRYSSGLHGDQRNVGPLWKLVSRDRDVQLVLWGHDHDYERMVVPVKDRRGKAAFVVGTGGAELRGATRVRGRTWSKRIVARKHGVLDLVLRPTGFSWRFVRVDGVGVDAGHRKVVRA